MQKDIKELFKNYKEEEANLSTKHSDKFEALLMQELHAKKPESNLYKWLTIAASIALIFTLGIGFLNDKDQTDTKPVENKISLGSISPEFQTIETYYVNSINLELSELEITEENKELLNGFLSKVEELANEYQLLTEELNTKGVNDETIDALINNLQLRLQLLRRLKKKLNTLKQLNSKENEIQIV